MKPPRPVLLSMPPLPRRKANSRRSSSTQQGGIRQSPHRSSDLVPACRASPRSQPYIGPVLAKHGLGYRYASKVVDTTVTVSCILFHFWGTANRRPLSSGFDTSGSKNHLQALGSTPSYLQRYSLTLVAGLSAGKDDDANSAVNAPPPKPVEQPQPINLVQYQELRDLMETANISEDRVLEVCGGTDLNLYNQSQFRDAKARLLNRIRDMKKGAEKDSGNE